MAYTSQNNTSTLPQGFSIFQPALGAQLQFLPAIGTPELDELINTYVAGPASTQEKRASVSLDFLEYAHLTGQTFKFYPVRSTNAVVESPATDSGYGSSFNVSPVTSNWDFSQISTSQSPPSQQVRTSPKAVPSRKQGADFSNLPGMKIMTKDGRDVTNSASRGSKTKEQRDHAHLMRIIKACDNCKRKKIRCDPSHKKRIVAQSQAQSATKSTKKTKAVARAVEEVTTPLPVPANVPEPAPSMSLDPTWAPIDLESFDASLSALEPWEEFIDYPPADNDYDFFNDPAGYFSPEASSSSVSTYSTKAVTPTSQSELAAPHDLIGGNAALASPPLPFNQTESTTNYVDFNLFSPGSSFSEDEQLVPIDLSQHLRNHSHSPQSSAFRSDQSASGSVVAGGLGRPEEDAPLIESARRSGKDERGAASAYFGPGSGEGGQLHSPLSPSRSSDAFTHLDTELSDRMKASTSGDTSSVPSSSSSSVDAGLNMSSITRGIEAYATTTAAIQTESGSLRGEPSSAAAQQPHDGALTPDSYGKYRRRMGTLSQSSSNDLHDLHDQSVALATDAPTEPRDSEVGTVSRSTRVETTTGDSSEDVAMTNVTRMETSVAVKAAKSSIEPQDSEDIVGAGREQAVDNTVAPRVQPQQPQTYAPSSVAAGGELTHMTSATLATVPDSLQSCVESFVATMIPAVVAVAACIMCFPQPLAGPKLKFPAGERNPSNKESPKRTAAAQSYMRRGMKPVSGMIHQPANLIAV